MLTTGLVIEERPIISIDRPFLFIRYKLSNFVAQINTSNSDDSSCYELHESVEQPAVSS